MELILRNKKINYQIHGEGTPILIIHGYGTDLQMMEYCMEPMFIQAEGYKRIYLDVPGMGKSEANNEIKNADQMLSVLIEFVRVVIGDEKFLIAGQSYGGYLTLGLVYKLSDQINGFFLLCPVTVAKHNQRVLPKKELFIHQDYKEIPIDDRLDYDDYLKYAVIDTEEIWNRYKREVLPGLKLADQEFTDYYQRTGYQYSFESQLRNLQFSKPAAIITGRQDNSVGFEDSFQLMKGLLRASFLTVDGAGHNLQIEQTETFEGFFSEWLHRVKDKRG